MAKRIIHTESYNGTAEGLVNLVSKFAEIATRAAGRTVRLDEIYTDPLNGVEVKFRLLEETLTDGSKAYGVYIS
jgi:hypothetical protein